MAKPDDNSIPDTARLLKALPFEGWWLDSGSGVRATSLAFVDRRSGETSCYCDNPAGRAAVEGQFGDCRRARFTAGQARAQGFNVTRDPAGDPAGLEDHVVLTYGAEGVSASKYQKACKQLALQCEIIEVTGPPELPPTEPNH